MKMIDDILSKTKDNINNCKEKIIKKDSVKTFYNISKTIFFSLILIVIMFMLFIFSLCTLLSGFCYFISIGLSELIIKIFDGITFNYNKEIKIEEDETNNVK